VETTPLHRSSRGIEQALSSPNLHQQWQTTYETDHNERFAEEAFDRLLEVTGAPPGASFLDAGCGSGNHAVRLARRGFRVRAVDFSDAALPRACQRVVDEGLEHSVTVERQDLLGVSFCDAAFDHVLCWGVLMHVPEVAGAISELTRVLRPAGCLVVSETNVFSLEAALEAISHRLSPPDGVTARRTPAGLEYWTMTEEGPFLWRRANPRWLVREVEAHGLKLEHRLPGQFTEAYTSARSATVQRALHGLNRFWFRHVRLPQPAMGSVFVFRKTW
jgi:2-polyprenyl-3-methyl-5-hydroxy-6-metoxy-1,4-benzoquinol methylase